MLLGAGRHRLGGGLAGHEAQRIGRQSPIVSHRSTRIRPRAVRLRAGEHLDGTTDSETLGLVMQQEFGAGQHEDMPARQQPDDDPGGLDEAFGLVERTGYGREDEVGRYPGGDRRFVGR